MGKVTCSFSSLWAVKRLLVAVAGMVFVPALGFAQPVNLPCSFDTASGSDWSSAYCDLTPPQNFKAGTSIHIKLAAGGAKRVLVRLLSDKQKAKQKIGIIGNVVAVPANLQIDVSLSTPQNHIEQISVQGGRKAWDIDLGDNNGDPIIERIWLQ